MTHLPSNYVHTCTGHLLLSWRSNLIIIICTLLHYQAKRLALQNFAGGHGFVAVKFNGAADDEMRDLQAQLSQELTETDGALGLAISNLAFKKLFVNFATSTILLFTAQSINHYKFSCPDRAQVFPCHAMLDGQWQAPHLASASFIVWRCTTNTYRYIYSFSKKHNATHCSLYLTCANEYITSPLSGDLASKVEWTTIEVVVAAASRFDTVVGSSADIGDKFINNQFGAAGRNRGKKEYPLQLLTSDSSYCMTVLLVGDSANLKPKIANVRHSIGGKQLHFL